MTDPTAQIMRQKDDIHALRKQLRVACEALDICILALDDWTHTYASELCDEAAVDRSLGRMQSGTLAYIADVRRQAIEARETVRKMR